MSSGEKLVERLKEQRRRLDGLEAELAARVSAKTTIYLDTNHWVYLKSVVLGRPGTKPEHVKLLADYRGILSLLDGLVSQGTICCPVSSFAFEELMKQSNEVEDSRQVTALLT